MDIREAIGKVMVQVHGPGLAGMGMGEVAYGEKNNVKFHSLSHHELQFDSQQNQLEPIYYWVLDFMAQVGWGNPEKTIDNFMASPGSGQFGEISQKAGIMQDRFDKMSSGLNQIIKSVLNLIYDLKEFEIRLAHYDDFHSDDKTKKMEGTLALKQIWLDNVDMKRQRGSIHQMTTMEMGYSTLRDAFMMADGVSGAEKMAAEDGLINDSVKRILIPRLSEFEKWVGYSETELRKRFKIEKNYLKSQVETIKLYSQWMKPYIENAEKLRQRGFEKDAALVNSFSTSMFELQLMKVKNVDAPNGYKARRDYHKVIVITLKYRGHVSQRVTQKGDYGFGMGGVVDIFFDSYAINSEELAAAKKLMDDDDIGKSMEYSFDIAGNALKEMQEDLDYFLKTDEEKEAIEAEKKKAEEKKSGSEDINPFTALFGVFFKKAEKKKDGKEKGEVEIENIKKDNFYEKKMRGDAMGVSGMLYTIYDVYKKAHRMASAPNQGFDHGNSGAAGSLMDGGSVGIKDIFRQDLL